jgi:gas vesicle protein
MQKFRMFIYGAFLGGITGALLATLFAPTSGNALRAQIEDRYMSIRSEVSQAATDKTKELRDELAKLQQREIPTE